MGTIPVSSQPQYSRTRLFKPVGRSGPSAGKCGIGNENFPAGLFPENFQPDFPKKTFGRFLEKHFLKFSLKKNFREKSKIKISHESIRTKNPAPLQKNLSQPPFFRRNNISDPGTHWPQAPLNSQSKPKMSPVLVKITPCLIKNSWKNCMNRGSGIYREINVGVRREVTSFRALKKGVLFLLTVLPPQPI